VFETNALYHDTPTELANNIIAIMRDTAYYSSIVKHNQEMILQNYSYEHIKQQTKEMFLHYA
jgi:hypothetical protein